MKRISKNHMVKVAGLSTFLFSVCLCLTGCEEEPVYNTTEMGVLKAVEDKYDATINSIVATDVYGRSFNEGDVGSSDRTVGMFYFIWHGEHLTNGIYDVEKLKKNDPDKLWTIPDEYKQYWLWDENKWDTDAMKPAAQASYPNKTASEALKQYVKDVENKCYKEYGLNQFHYFSEPLYGYYCSDDPWVLTRHIELLTMSGVDYIALDLTNISIYEENTTAVLEKLLEFQNKGWKVPLVTSFLTGSDVNLGHPARAINFYNKFYTNPKWDSLWYRDPFSNKPIVYVGMKEYYPQFDDALKANLKCVNHIYPYDKRESVYDDASWMDWQYPARVYENSYGNFMNVSVSHHVAGSFGVSVNPNLKDKASFRDAASKFGDTNFRTGGDSNYNANRGRGWDYSLNKNVKENVNKGSNLETQWNNAINSEKQVDEVFVTGWNEWVAYKLPMKQFYNSGSTPAFEQVYKDYVYESTFCDTCDEEFSRDLEMTKEGYGDNFYLLNMKQARNFKFRGNVKYAGEYTTEYLTNKNWKNAREYLDFTGDAIARNYARADVMRSDRATAPIEKRYINETNRNDIKATRVSHDANNLYVQIECLNDIVIDESANNNLNLLLSLKDSNLPSYNGYNFVLNRKALTQGSGLTTLEKFTSSTSYELETISDSIKTYMDGKVVSIAIPLNKLGIEKDADFTIDFKVADGISDPSNIMLYYVDGDSAPIGRLNYRYNSSLIK